MKKLRIRLNFIDKYYQQRFSSYIKTYCHSVFELCEDNEQALLELTEDGANIDIRVKEECLSISRFQSTDRLLNIIADCIRRTYNTQETSSSNTRQKIIALTSAHGGAGKSFIAQALAIYAAKIGKSVLFLSLDSSSTGELVFQSPNANDLSLLMHFLNKTDQEFSNNKERYINFAYNLEKYKNHDPVHNVYYLSSIYPSVDCTLTENTVEDFVFGLKQNSMYDYVILDIPFIAQKAYMELFKFVNKNIFIKSRASIREQQLLEFFKSHEINLLEVCNRIQFVEGIYVSECRQPLGQANKQLFDAMESILYECEK